MTDTEIKRELLRLYALRRDAMKHRSNWRRRLQPGGYPARDIDNNIRHYTAVMADCDRRIATLGFIHNGVPVVKRVGQTTKQIIGSTNLTQVMRLFTVGFELETQATQGLDAATAPRRAEDYNRGRTENPERAAGFRRREAARARTNPDVLANIIYSSAAVVGAPVKLAVFKSWAAKLPPEDRAEAEAAVADGSWLAATKSIDASRLMDMVREQKLGVRQLESLAELPSDAADTISSYIERQVRGARLPDYCYDRPVVDAMSVVHTVLPNFDPKLLEVTRDGSVRGFEIRTRGGLTPANFIKACGIVFGRNVQHSIDVGCSFHLHVGVPGASLSYSREFQCALYEYLLDKIDRVPDTVRERWLTLTNDQPQGRYFRLHLNGEKYSFVHYHPRCGTWEFRCFGNVRNKRDAVRCLRLALGAMVYAFKVTRGQKVKPLITPTTFSDYTRTMLECISTKKPLTTLIKKGAS